MSSPDQGVDRVPWNGQGLPPSANARIARSKRSGLTTSLLPVGGDTALESVGFFPIGEVMGSCALHFGFRRQFNCGYGMSVTSRYESSTAQGQRVGGLNDGYGAAISRMVSEAHQLGAHGVVGVRLTLDRRDTGTVEFIALGTAVRGAVSQGAALPGQPFTTSLSGADVTCALRNGWVPVSIAVAISLGVRHDDYATYRQASGWSNTEVEGYTRLVNSVRDEARDAFARRVASSGATHAYVSRMNLRVWSAEPSENHRDHVAEAMVVGGGLVPFERSKPPSTGIASTLTVLPLRRRT